MEHVARDLESKTAQDVMAWALDTKIALAWSGAEDVVVSHLEHASRNTYHLHVVDWVGANVTRPFYGPLNHPSGRKVN